ncbi:MAG: DUF3445 domain-containing protein [Pseudomonadota bacterium]
MRPILQSHVPYDVSDLSLPGVKPFEMKNWLWQDDAFAEQMALRDMLVLQQYPDVVGVTEAGRAAADELLVFVLDWLHAHGTGYAVSKNEVHRPDGVDVPIDRNDPMGTLGRLVQEDLCVLTKHPEASEHTLAAAALCFPASWRLQDKLGRSLVAIHDPVPSYDGSIARRVQRLFDGVQADRPMWRFNALNYADPSLHQPDRRDDEYARSGASDAYFRSERQCILRLPETQACVFSIHTFVVLQAGYGRV